MSYRVSGKKLFLNNDADLRLILQYVDKRVISYLFKTYLWPHID